MKRFLIAVSITSLLFALTACSKTKTLHCDQCGTEVQVEEKSNMEEDWLVFCEECGDIDLNN